MNATYLTSAKLKTQLPETTGPEVCVVGRSNCGKSTLLNALFGTTKLVKTSSTAGHTKMINFFRLQAPEGILTFADLPGYGYSATGKKARGPWAELVDAYFKRPGSRHHLFLMDARRSLDEEDKGLLSHLWQLGATTVVLTKGDKLKQAEKAKRISSIERELSEMGGAGTPVVLASGLKGSGVKALRDTLWEWASSLEAPSP